MLRSRGLYTYFENNNVKCILLLFAFLFVGQSIVYAVWTSLGISLLGVPSEQRLLFGLEMIRRYWQETTFFLVVWTAIAYWRYGHVVRATMGCQPVDRSREFRLYNLAENLAIAQGLPLPRLEIIESNGLNAFAMGLHLGDATIVVTRGLLANLGDQELEAVLAHEFSHIKNRDIRLVSIASIVSGIVFLAYDFLVRPLYKFGLRTMALIVALPTYPVAAGLTVIVVALVSVLFAFLIKFAIGRNREYVADAAAFEMTKNPGALISALTKISGRAYVGESDYFANSMLIAGTTGDWFSTHPPIQSRIDALRSLGGASVVTPSEQVVIRTISNRVVRESVSTSVVLPPEVANSFSLKQLRELQYGKWVGHWTIACPLFAICWAVFFARAHLDASSQLYQAREQFQKEKEVALLETGEPYERSNDFGLEHGKTCFFRKFNLPKPGTLVLHVPNVDSRETVGSNFIDFPRLRKFKDVDSIRKRLASSETGASYTYPLLLSMNEYINNRISMTVSYFENFGEAGVAYTNKFYATAEDFSLKAEFMKLVQSGVLKHGRKVDRVLAHLDLPPNSYTPCLKPSPVGGSFTTLSSDLVKNEASEAPADNNATNSSEGAFTKENVAIPVLFLASFAFYIFVIYRIAIFIYQLFRRGYRGVTGAPEPESPAVTLPSPQISAVPGTFGKRRT